MSRRRTVSIEGLSSSDRAAFLVANLHGQRCEGATFRRGGRHQFSCRRHENRNAPIETLSEDELEERRHILYERMAASGRFTTLQLQRIYRVLILRWTFQAIAAADGRSVASVSDSFHGTHGHGGIFKKTPPEFLELLQLTHPKLRKK